MGINHLILQNLKNNVRNYYLYIFALIFSVALYFSFVTLQYDSSMESMKESLEGDAAIKAGSIFLVVIVSVFVLYANNIFIKRRSKEIGLFHLMGMTKGKIFGILSAENVILYVGSLSIGIFLGFSASKLIVMILLKVTGIETVTALQFSTAALVETVVVFVFIYLLMMLANIRFINKQSILSLFQASSTIEQKVKKLSLTSIVIGICGIGCIALGYYLSTRLFSGHFPGYKLFAAMIVIMGSIVVGTYLFYKGSVSFIFHLIRKKKDGYISLNHVLSLSPIMFRMKSNALLLTMITIVSALAIGLLSLMYIAYYSSEQTAEQMTPHHFAIFSEEDQAEFTSTLKDNGIDYAIKKTAVPKVLIDLTDVLVPGSYEHLDIGDDPWMLLRVISDRVSDDIELSGTDAILTEPDDSLGRMLSFKETGNIEISGESATMDLQVRELTDEKLIPQRLTNGFSVAMVADDVFQQIVSDADPSMQDEFSVYVGVDIKQSRQLEKANEIFHKLELDRWTGIWEGYESQPEAKIIQKQGVGLTMFIFGFLGLTFLITSGCILYFKQMNESDEEKHNYTILRKLGFTKADLLHGIRIKQLLNFGIPLVLGLCHSYFIIKSGWFIFGSEMWVPMITVMILYTSLYAIFGLLSVQYTKRIIHEAL